MQTILCMNAKGGCGKTTLATNLATWYADEGYRTAVLDYDPQGSAIDWLVAREDFEGVPTIEGVDAVSGEARAYPLRLLRWHEADLLRALLAG